MSNQPQTEPEGRCHPLIINSQSEARGPGGPPRGATGSAPRRIFRRYSWSQLTQLVQQRLALPQVPRVKPCGDSVVDRSDDIMRPHPERVLPTP